MKSGKKLPLQWIPSYIDKRLFGSTRRELDPGERSVWDDLLHLAGKDDGWIRANEQTAYLPEQLSGLFVVPIELLLSTIKKCITHNKIEYTHGIMRIINWDTYQLTDKRKQQMIPKKETSVLLDRTPIIISSSYSSSILDKILSYLNSKTGKNFKGYNKETVGLVKARISEGRTIEDFQKVIDTKVAQWTNDPKMERYLRPNTLFRPSNFESYLNEKQPETDTERNNKWIEKMEKKANANKPD